MSRRISLDHVHFDHDLILRLASYFERYPGTSLIFSGGEQPQSQRSFLGLFPYESLEVTDKHLIHTTINSDYFQVNHQQNPWGILKDYLTVTSDSRYPEWIGYFCYEMGAYSDPDKQFNLQPNKTLPNSFFHRCALVFEFDHINKTTTLVVSHLATYVLPIEQRKWVEKLTCKEFWPAFVQQLREISFLGSMEFSSSEVVCSDTFETYKKKVDIAQEYIKAGDIYQVNLSQSFEITRNINAFQMFYQLVQKNPSSFSAFLRLKEGCLVSSSPERLLRKQGDVLETRPIKGTAPRGKTEEEDRQLKEGLLTSPKEKAELLMITDLMRNDLGKISVAGTVSTDELWHCEEYQNVFHMVSTIRSKAFSHLHPIEIMRACFPGGSITGCPKLRAMEVIAELEKRPRGIYTGSIGYFSGNGDFDFNIAIRTLLIQGNKITVQLGGAIVHDSNAQQEYEETLHKGASIFQVLGIV